MRRKIVAILLAVMTVSTAVIGCGDNEITLLILSAYNKKKMGYQ